MKIATEKEIEIEYDKRMHLIKESDWTPEYYRQVLDLARKIKQHPEQFGRVLQFDDIAHSTLHFFAQPSTRTRISFNEAVAQLGGIPHPIDLDAKMPMGSKENLYDTIRSTAYVPVMSLRTADHGELEQIATIADIHGRERNLGRQNLGLAALPSMIIINAMTDGYHPCQGLADFQTMQEYLGNLEGKTLCFFGNGNNNVTHSLILGGALVGMNVRIACPQDEKYFPQANVLKDAQLIANATGSSISVYHDAKEAAQGIDAAATDTFVNYSLLKGKSEEEQLELLKEMKRVFMPFQVNTEIMSLANKGAIFLHCLPKANGYEVSEEVADNTVESNGQSVVFAEAENRVHAQKAVMVNLLYQRLALIPEYQDRINV